MAGLGYIELLILGAFCLLFIMVPIIIVIVVLVMANRKRSVNNPNLAPCPDYGRAVSPSATSCPVCGQPFNADT